MATIRYTLKKGQSLTKEQERMISEAAAKPIVFDEDSPELTEEILKKFRRVGRKAENQEAEVFF